MLPIILLWSHPAAAGCKALPNSKGTAKAKLHIPATGKYRLWAHIYVPSVGSSNFYMQLAGYCSIDVGGGKSAPAKAFTWVDYQQGKTNKKIDLSLKEGDYNINFAGHSAGVGVDKLLLLRDTSCVPMGDGKNCQNDNPPAVTPMSNDQNIAGSSKQSSFISSPAGMELIGVFALILVAGTYLVRWYLPAHHTPMNRWLAKLPWLKYLLAKSTSLPATPETAALEQPAQQPEPTYKPSTVIQPNDKAKE